MERAGGGSRPQMDDLDRVFERDARRDFEDIAAGEERSVERGERVLGIARSLGDDLIEQLRPLGNRRRSWSEPHAFRHFERGKFSGKMAVYKDEPRSLPGQE